MSVVYADMKKSITFITGCIVGGFLYTLWAFHIFFSGSQIEPILPTIAYGVIYVGIGVLGYHTFLKESVTAYDELFVFFNVIPGALYVLIIWALIYSKIF
ncbi:MAG: hypothetical protein UZ22_OP11002000955 [Microgenomates bacterium OLB23]|nr:MAG: hypothetical protein UZ22_OP11002000955 [Microgenomates bacterium OLB23]